MGNGAKKIAVLGGGIAGLTAAHELTKRGYEVTVFEASGCDAEHLGGKARSFFDDDQPYGRMFGEHGFRFFPGFYRNVIETMKEIDDQRGGCVDGRLYALPTSCFYAKASPKPTERDEPTKLQRVMVAARQGAGKRVRRFGVHLFLAWLLIGGWLVWYLPASWWVRAVWIAFPIVWFVCRTVAFAWRPADGNSLTIPVPGDRPPAVPAAQCWLITKHRWWRFVGLALACVPVVLAGICWQSIALALIVAVIAWWYPLFATVRHLWGILQQIPIGVRPGILESVAASLKIVCIVAACERRTYRQWERDSWWSYIGAYRYSRAFELAFATGLTRSFVATRAERMSARTGATILAQLLYDVSPTLRNRDAADRVLDAPTHVAWIEPWVCQLKDAGVKFNEFLVDGEWEEHERVEVTALLPDDGDRIAGFRYVERPGDKGTLAPQVFDHYVLAVSGTGAQRILANSADLVARDQRITHVKAVGVALPGRPDGRAVPHLNGIFDLEFGWMTGVVYHLDRPVKIAEAHHLCLESEWALTAIDVAPIWRKRNHDLEGWTAVVSVNISDWSSASSRAFPARFESLERVRRETWRQLCEHIPDLGDPDDVPPFVPDRAINDPDKLELPKRMPTLVGETVTSAVLENLPLTNDETLLINTAGSWEKRPTAQTAFQNLVIAGDYVRTLTDFASMESANEAAKRAVNVILAHDHSAHAPCDLYGLPVPGELKRPIGLVAALDRVAYTFRFPHPLMLVASPIGWFAGSEQALQRFTQWGRRRLRPPRDAAPQNIAAP